MNNPITTPNEEKNIIQQMRGRPVTHEEAAASAQRLINSHFHNPDRARMQIPANPSDDDLIITDYIIEQRSARPVSGLSAGDREKLAIHAYRYFCRHFLGKSGDAESITSVHIEVLAEEFSEVLSCDLSSGNRGKIEDVLAACEDVGATYCAKLLREVLSSSSTKHPSTETEDDRELRALAEKATEGSF